MGGAAVKVRVTMTVDIDPEAWDQNYDTGTDLAKIREDVRQYVTEAATDQLRTVGVLIEPGGRP